MFQGYNASSVIFDKAVKPKRDALDDWRVSAPACDSESDPGTHRVMSIIAARVCVVCTSHCSVLLAGVPVLLGCRCNCKFEGAVMPRHVLGFDSKSFPRFGAGVLTT